MASTSTKESANLEREYANLSVDDDEDEVFDVDAEDLVDDRNFEFCMVGRFMDGASIKLEAIKQFMKMLWRSSKNVSITDLGNSLFQFRFHCRRDFDRAIEGGPWTFKNRVLLWAPLNPKVPVASMSLFLMDIWVRVFNLPAAFRSDKMCRHIGKFLGGYVYVDERSFSGEKQEFIRLRVSLDVRRPIKKTMKLRSTGVQTFQIVFKYERIPSFCFHCGRIGHSDRGCDMLADIGLRDRNIVMNYGPGLRVSFGPKSNTEEDEWVKNGDVYKGSADEVHEPGSRVIVLRGEEDTTRKNGDEGRVKSNQITNPLFLDENEDVEMISAVDAKRKRVEKGGVLKPIDLNRTNNESNGAVVSKNELSAGPGVQARRSQ